jgi:hypothetical protein
MDKEEKAKIIKEYCEKVWNEGTVFSQELLEEFKNYVPDPAPRNQMTDEEKELRKTLDANGYISVREVPGRGLCGLHKLLYTTGIVYGLDECGYVGRYCYDHWWDAFIALTRWDGVGDPIGNWIVNKGERGGDRYNPNRKRDERSTEEMP